jgi:hypothetical protein
MEKFHAKGRNYPADDLYDNDTNHDRHATSVDSGEHLASDYSIDGTVTNLLEQ